MNMYTAFPFDSEVHLASKSCPFTALAFGAPSTAVSIWVSHLPVVLLSSALQSRCRLLSPPASPLSFSLPQRSSSRNAPSTPQDRPNGQPGCYMENQC